MKLMVAEVQNMTGWAKVLIPSIVVCVGLLAGSNRWAGQITAKIDTQCEEGKAREVRLAASDVALAKAIKDGDASLANKLGEASAHLTHEIERVYLDGCKPSVAVRADREAEKAKLETLSKRVEKMDIKQDKMFDLIIDISRQIERNDNE